MRKLTSAALVAFLAAMVMVATPVATAATNHFKLVWSIYVGWMPWDYANVSGILAKHAKVNGITVEVQRMEYMPSVAAFVSKQFDAAVMTNMEALDNPASSGVDTTSVVIGDYSNDNDQLQVRGISDVNGLRGQKTYLAVNSVSHYLLNRCLELKSNLRERDLVISDMAEGDLVTAVKTQPNVKATVTWNPFVMEVAQVDGVRRLCGSADIPGEILDLLVVRTDVLRAHPELGRTLVATWYEVMNLMTRRGNSESAKALNMMAKASNASLAEFNQQLQTTAMFYTPQSAVQFTESAEIKKKMEFVRQFCFSHGLLLAGKARSVDAVGIQYPDGTVQGNRNNIKFRFDSSFMRAAAAKK